jgi:cell division protein FtsB
MRQTVAASAPIWLMEEPFCGQFAPMRSMRRAPRLEKDRVVQLAALGALLMMAGFVVAGPSGVIAWTENERLLVQHEKRIAQLSAEREQLRNRVRLLDPRQADPDLAGELLRSNLNVAHPDEMVMLLPKQP